MTTTSNDRLEQLLAEYAAADKALYDFCRDNGGASAIDTDQGYKLCRSSQVIAEWVKEYVVAEMVRLGTCVGWVPTRYSIRSIHHQKQPDGSFGLVFSPSLAADKSGRTQGRAMFPHVHVRIPSTAAIPAAIEFFNGMVARETEMQRATRAALAAYNSTVGNT